MGEEVGLLSRRDFLMNRDNTTNKLQTYDSKFENLHRMNIILENILPKLIQEQVEHVRWITLKEI